MRPGDHAEFNHSYEDLTDLSDALGSALVFDSTAKNGTVGRWARLKAVIQDVLNTNLDDDDNIDGDGEMVCDNR